MIWIMLYFDSQNVRRQFVTTYDKLTLLTFIPCQDTLTKKCIWPFMRRVYYHEARGPITEHPWCRHGKQPPVSQTRHSEFIFMFWNQTKLHLTWAREQLHCNHQEYPSNHIVNNQNALTKAMLRQPPTTPYNCLGELRTTQIVFSEI